MAFALRSTDQMFRRYCRTGDPQALGVVFDRTAPELLRIAGWLVGNRADAEDLLQHTFLLAIEARGSFDHTQRALPWLCGILSNQARNLRRERARRAALGTTPGAARDPAAAAMDTEFGAAVLAARAAISAPYREVLELHLTQGLNSKQIAEKLGRPAGTVRTQLMRALELLRKRLPSGFVTGFAPVAADSASLGIVKAAVLAHAHSVAPTVAGGVGSAATMAAAGGMLMGKKIALAIPVVAVLLGTGAYFALPGEPAATDRDLQPPVAQVTAIDDTSHAAAADTGNHGQANAAASPREVMTMSAPAGGPIATIRGRCIDAQGRPVPGCIVELSGSAPSEADYEKWIQQHPDRPWHQPEPLSTTADGDFELHFAPLPILRFSLRLSHPQYVPLSAHWQRIAEGAEITLADAVLQAGTHVRGTVKDELGRPVAGVSVNLGQERSGSPDGILATMCDLGQRTDAAGTFEGGALLPPGVYRPNVWERAVAAPESVTIPLGLASLDVAITILSAAALGEITGVLADDRGKPIDQAEVRSIPEGAFTRTAQDGSFRLVRDKNMTRTPVRLAVCASGCERYDGDETLAWGATDVRIVLRRGIDLEVHAHTADGAAVPDYQVRFFLGGGSGAEAADLYTLCHSASGVAQVSGARRGSLRLIIVPAADEFAATTFVPVEVRDPGPQHVDVVVPRCCARQLVVQRADGKPVAGSTVRLVDPLGATTELNSPMLPLGEWDHVMGKAKTLLVQEITTAAEGSAVLRGPSDRALDLVLLGPGHVPQIQRGVLLTGEGPLLVTVAGGATILGKVKPAGVIAELRQLASLPATGELDAQQRRSLPALRLQRGDGAQRETHPNWKDPPIPLLDDGTFHYEGAPPGRWSLTLEYETCFSAGSIKANETVASVDLRPGETTTVDADLARFVTGQLDATVLLNGRPLASRSILVHCDPGSGPFGAGEPIGLGCRCDAAGRIHLRGRPGVYQLEWQQRNYTVQRTPETAIVVAGQTTTQTFTFTYGIARLRVLDPAGEPVARLGITLRSATGDQDLSLPETDNDGRAMVPLVPGTYSCLVPPKRLLDPATQRQLSVANRGNTDVSGPLLLRIGKLTVRLGEETELELRLPAEWAR